MDLNISSQDSSCFHLPHPLFDLASERFITNLITAIVNIVTAPFSFIANMLIIIAIFDCPRLQTPSNLFLATLALSDAFVGLTVQPGYITYRLMENQHRSVPCFARHIYNSAFYVCFGVSFMTLTAVSYERFVAVRLRVRYNAMFSTRRALKYALGIWTVNIFLTALEWAKIDKAMRGIHLTLWYLCLLVSTVTQIGVFVAIRRHNRRVSNQLQVDEKLQRQREVKLAKKILTVVVIYFILNFPVLFVTFYHQIFGQNIQTYNHYSWTETLAFLNSCSNPIICYWKKREIFRRVKYLLKKLIC